MLAFALGIAFKNRGPGELRIGVLRAARETAPRLASSRRRPRLTAVRAGQRGRAAALRTGRVALLVVPGDPLVYRYDSTRTESRLARLEVDDALQRDRVAAPIPPWCATIASPSPGSRYIDFLIPGLLGMNLMGSGLWGVGFSVVQARTKGSAQAVPRDADAEERTTCCRYMLSRLLFLVLEVAALIGFGWLVFDVGVRRSRSWRSAW